MSDLAARLTEAAEAVATALTDDEVAAIRRYQGLDRSYELVASVLRGLRSPEDLTAGEAELVTMILRALPVSIARWEVPEPLRVYRGQRSVARLLGSGPRDQRVLVANSFLSTTIFREVALEEFTKPAGPGGPALLEISVPAGHAPSGYHQSATPLWPTRASFCWMSALASPSGVSDRTAVSWFWTARWHESFHGRGRGLPPARRAPARPRDP